MRTANIERTTTETAIRLSLNLDGTGSAEIDTGCGFLNHMLILFTRHGRFDLSLTCVGDTDIDYHHSTEDIGICLGRAVRSALGEMRGITRFGSMVMPMDEALVLCAMDISGRAGFYPALSVPTEKVGDFDTELCEEFFHAFVREAGITLHLRQLAGCNSHHILEACFKAFGRTLCEAVKIDDSFRDAIPSTKGVLG